MVNDLVLSAFWAVALGIAHRIQSKRMKREIRKVRQDVQTTLYQDRQIRKGNVGTITGIRGSGNGSGGSR